MKFWLCVSLLLAAPELPGLRSAADTANGATRRRESRRAPVRMKPCWRGCGPGVILRDGGKTVQVEESCRRPGFRNQGMARRLLRTRHPARTGRQIRDPKHYDHDARLQEKASAASGARIFLNPKNWVTGLGLRIGDSQDRIVGLYGEPNSSGPAMKNGQELELMYLPI